MCHMSLDLTDAELAAAEQPSRAMAYQEGERARKMENPTTRGPIENTAKRYAALAEKLEAARKHESVLRYPGCVFGSADFGV
jgi:hypothetical protein